ncbi:MAG TPA: DUF6600 domain-containing protein [Chitinophagaceae bacterium]|nr:DUF6600 domain-containing protein [Chitinophagaceae bacterium]
MKRILKTSIIVAALVLMNSFRNTASAQVSASISFQNFYDDLSPYGQWIDYPQYGYVWNPHVGADFRPYGTMGHWEYSDDYNWIWVSDYDWGWAPFHYGRWFYDPVYGWLWVPGYDWSPAWVAWRSGGDFYGWAPLSPGIDIGFSIGGYAPPVDYWCFAPRRYITSPRIFDYCVSPRMNFTIVNNTTIINNFNFYGGRGRNVFVNGPRRDEVERFTHDRIRPVVFRDSDRPGRTEFRDNSISMYRPSVNRNNNDRFAPRNFDRFNSRPQNNNGIRREDNAFDRGNNNNGIRQDNNGWQARNDRNPFEQRTNNLPQRNDQNQTNPFERRQTQTPNNNRNFDNRNNDRSNQFERRQQLNQDNNRNFGNRNFGNQNNNQQRQMSQPRQFEHRDEGNRGQGSGNSNRGGGGGGRRRG